jgi:hypothetical protein
MKEENRNSKENNKKDNSKQIVNSNDDLNMVKYLKINNCY